MFVAFRTITYATLFVGFLLIYVPDRLLAWSGIHRPAAMEAQQIMGIVVATAGAALALWCVVSFVSLGKGTPAPFDPPRHLVVRGPYRFVRNPMYIGASLALGGAALFYGSLSLLEYAVVFLFAASLFVLGYEEPKLRRTFGHEYEDYCHHVPRWLPRV
jgi:protein-S-isoprenylcysteine O-methyltransferase Ste14